MARTETHGGDSARCTSDRCPQCGRTIGITIERVVRGQKSMNQCHCRFCGASWTVEIEGEQER